MLFLPIGCASHAFFKHIAEKPAEEFPFQSMRSEDDEEIAGLRRVIASVSDLPSDGDRVAECLKMSSSLVLIRTSAEIEGEYLDHVNLLKNKEYVPVGPLVGKHRRQHESEPRLCRLFSWLDEKPESSVAFVSFGSEYYMQKEEMAEIARGLELSGVCFLWVIRFPKGEEVPLEEAFPEKFQERNSGRGMLVEGWAPQEEILGHPAVGAFVTHCGWGSVIEALARGVPMVAMPQYFDQPLNAKLVTALFAGVQVRGLFAGDGGKSCQGEELAAALSREIAEVLRRKGDAEVDVAAAKLAELIRSAGGYESGGLEP